MGVVVRVGIIVVGLLLMLGGLGLLVAGGETGAAIEALVFGGFLIVVVALERQRYRSDAAEATNATAGPGGGETADRPIDPRFKPTAEVFVDPTSGHQMRVLVDPATGERRYVAEA